MPLAVSLVVALVVTPLLLHALAHRGWVRPNYRGTAVAFPAGVALVVAAVLAHAPLGLLDAVVEGQVLAPGTAEALTYVLGVALLGLIDDLVGEHSGARGWRGHAGALAAGRLSTGALKAVGSLALALFVLAGEGLGPLAYPVAVLLLVLTTNLFNLLDLRPGRSIKALVLLGAAVTLAVGELEPLWVLGVFLGPILVLGPLDLRERGMLGDTGSNAVGAVAGLWLVLALPAPAQVVALALVALVTVYGEVRSISAFIERTPGLRALDSLGRTHA